MIEYQVGPCLGVSACDELWMSRYILLRICEAEGIHVSFDPKPVEEQSGAGLHTNYSTRAMRAPGGFSAILTAIEHLAAKHLEHIAVYGVGNEDRLTGEDDAPSIDTFTFGVATRAGSVRIPREVERKNCGYLEDRRPAANADPYVVCAKIFKTTVVEVTPPEKRSGTASTAGSSVSATPTALGLLPPLMASVTIAAEPDAPDAANVMLRSTSNSATPLTRKLVV
ncbi:hypothetical protein EON67_04105 [archaeon]|nr:MAG: hypothetical protein EON67_04105 [archaeon]